MSPFTKGMSPPDGPQGFASVPNRSGMLSKAFWAAASERAVKTFAQALVAIIGVAGVTPADIDWKQAVLGGGLASLVSVLTSVVSSGVGNDGPSLTSETIDPPVAPVIIDPEV